MTGYQYIMAVDVSKGLKLNEKRAKLVGPEMASVVLFIFLLMSLAALAKLASGIGFVPNSLLLIVFDGEKEVADDQQLEVRSSVYTANLFVLHVMSKLYKG